MDRREKSGEKGARSWTREQEKVIRLRDRNLLVSASAGSGKTASLVERIVQMVTSKERPVDVDRLLVVTFTEAAAGEMRERILEAIEEKILEEPANLHLQKQTALLHSAQISTIHSFCLNVIRNYFNVIDLDPSFRIGDETEMKLLQSDALSEVLEELYEEGSEDFHRFIETYATGKSDRGVEEMVFRLRDFAMSHVWPREWLEGQREAFRLQGGIESVPGMPLLLDDVRRMLGDFGEAYDALLGICARAGGPYMYEAVLTEERERLMRLKEANGYLELSKGILSLSFGRLPGTRDEAVDPGLREVVRNGRAKIKKEAERLRDAYFFQPPEAMEEDIRKVGPVMGALLDLCLLFMDRYQEKKAEKGVVDFDDMEHLALSILARREGENATGPEGANAPEKADAAAGHAAASEEADAAAGAEETGHAAASARLVPTEAARELSASYEEILIDEYQDSNRIQEEILRSVSRESQGRPNVLMVGDVKQSIYKFRLARPEMFMEKYETYSLEDSPYQKISLQENFRSRPEVLNSINYIFQGIMRKELGGIAYDRDAMLRRGARFRPARQGRSLWKTKVILAECGEEDKELAAQETEARAIAREIRRYVSGGLLIWDGKTGKYRAPSYKDIVILLRSPKSWADKMSEILREEGIPAMADVRTGYFSAMEVRTVLNFLAVIDNPLQDIPLTGVLTSFLGKFTEEELAGIRAGAGEETMYESLSRAAGADPSGKAGEFLRLLASFREMAPLTDVYGMIQAIYERTGFYDYVSVLPGGAARTANLDMLLEKAADFGKTSYGGLFQFNRYIERLHEYDVDFGGARGLEGEDDVVRLMSIHKSKGLEFPVVFLAGLMKRFNQQDARSRLALHPDFGIGPDYVDADLRTKAPTLPKKILQRRILLENLGEELRILYVALTRAKEKLVLVGSGKSLSDILDGWAQGGWSYLELTRARSYGDFVGPRIYRRLAGARRKEEKREAAGPAKARDAAGGEAALDAGGIFAEAGIASEDGLFEIELLTGRDLVGEEVLEELGREEKAAELLSWGERHPLTEEEKEAIASYLRFSYPHKGEVRARSKISVSELTKGERKWGDDEPSVRPFDRPLDDDDVPDDVPGRPSDGVDGARRGGDARPSDRQGEALEELGGGKEEASHAEARSEKGKAAAEAYVPDFARKEERLLGAGKGTAYHKAMEKMGIWSAWSAGGAAEELLRLTADRILTEKERDALDERRISRFLLSPLGERMAMAERDGRLHRERPFVIGVPAREVDPMAESEETVLVQGIVDAYFEEGDGLVLVDYKTDRVADAGRLLRLYRGQLACYGRALEQITGKCVRERWIYSFHLGEAILA